MIPWASQLRLTRTITSSSPKVITPLDMVNSAGAWVWVPPCDLESIDNDLVRTFLHEETASKHT